MAGELIILLAEDDPDDVFQLKRAFKKNNITLPVHVSPDGEDAMSYLRGEGPYADRTRYPFPRVLITDLKMPKRTGFELLRWLYHHPECNLIPKIVLSNSRMEQDVKQSYQLGVNCYLVKPATFDEMCDLVGLVFQFWTRCELPPLPTNC